jgi:hypothetical protein
VAATSIALTVLGAIIFSVKVPMMYRLSKRVGELEVMRREIAATINAFPTEEEFALEVGTTHSNGWRQLETRLAGDAELTDEFMLKVYEVLRRVSGQSAVKFSEAVTDMEQIKSDDDYMRVNAQFTQIQITLRRNNDLYRSLMAKRKYGSQFDLSINGLKQRAMKMNLSEAIDASKRIISDMRSESLVGESDYERIYGALRHLESRANGLFVSPSERRKAELDHMLVACEIAAYVPDHILSRQNAELDL